MYVCVHYGVCVQAEQDAGCCKQAAVLASIKSTHKNDYTWSSTSSLNQLQERSNFLGKAFGCKYNLPLNNLREKGHL